MVSCGTTSHHNVTLYPRWMLTGSMILASDTSISISTNQSIQLKSGKSLKIVMIDGDMYNDTNLGELSGFSIVLLNVMTEINGLSVRCGLWWEEKNVTLLYRQAAVVTVATKNKCESKG